MLGLVRQRGAELVPALERAAWYYRKAYPGHADPSVSLDCITPYCVILNEVLSLSEPQFLHLKKDYPTSLSVKIRARIPQTSSVCYSALYVVERHDYSPLLQQ